MLKSVDDQYNRRLEGLLEHTVNLPPSILVSSTYEGIKKVAVLKFYDPVRQTIHLWYDNSGHKPYCYSKLPPDQLRELQGRNDIIDFKIEEKYDLLQDKNIDVTRIIATDPLAIGGPSDQSVRNLIPVWEADIKYYENYIYDKGLITGLTYEINDSKIISPDRVIPTNVLENLDKWLNKSDKKFQSSILDWMKLFSQQLPELKRSSIDIEVYSSKENRIPDAREAEFQIISVAMVGSDGIKNVHLLLRDDIRDGERSLPNEVNLFYYEKEKNLIREVFRRMLDYPFILSFNGDDFDLNYLYNRARRLGIENINIPISLGRDTASIKHGVHVDLYKTFANRSLQIYAFGGKYTDHSLNGVSQGLLGQSKVSFEGSITELSLHELAKYNYHDALITFNLTAFDNDLLMKILTVVSRVAKMPIDDIARLGVSQWIRSMMYFEHRKLNALIPKKAELENKGGATSEATIKGKKYKGGLVVEPTAGIHFNVSVLDFASLYPSIIKVHNLSYETVRCPHTECRDNLVPETDHWVCKKRNGISSLVIGSLRDLRVNYYKPLSKSKSLSTEDKVLYNVVSQALKVILNASYGVMGAELFPLYCLPVAEATASLGRHAIKQTIKKCKDLEIAVVYGDTDSLFLQKPSSDQIEEVKDWAERDLGIELDLEKTYRFVAFSDRKKNYMGILPDGSVDIKGLTGKKSHTPPFIRKAFYDTVSILSKVMTESDFENAREEIKKDLRLKVQSLKNREIPIENLAFSMMLSKDPDKYPNRPQHVKAAKQLQDLKKKDIRSGDIITFVKTNTSEGVKPLELAKIADIDNDKYIDYLRGTFDQLLDALGYDFEEILGSTKLEDFFWKQ